MLQICQITDLHVEEDKQWVSGVDTYGNFLKVIDLIRSKPFDLLIISGDLCNTKGMASTYIGLKVKLDALPFPYLVLPGNHDDATLMAKSFELNYLSDTKELYGLHHLNGEDIICLDSSLAVFSENQWNWLEDQIKKCGHNVLIVMHHPPMASGVKHLEPKYAFTQMDRFMDLCHKYVDKQFQVFCGHYHTERTITTNNLQVFITPSTFLQIDPDQETLTTIKDWIAYRSITVVSGQCTMTRIVVCQ